MRACMPFTVGLWQRVLKRKFERIPQFFSAAQQPISGLDHVIAQVSRSHTVRHIQPVGRFSTSGQFSQDRYLHSTQKKKR